MMAPHDSISTFTLFLTILSRLIVLELLFQHQTRHLHTFETIERGIRLIVVLFFLRALIFLSTSFCSMVFRWDEKNLVHFFLCHVEAILESLRARRIASWRHRFTTTLTLFKLVLILCLLEDPQQLELLPKLLLLHFKSHFLIFNLSRLDYVFAAGGWLYLEVLIVKLLGKIAESIVVLSLFDLVNHLKDIIVLTLALPSVLLLATCRDRLLKLGLRACETSSGCLVTLIRGHGLVSSVALCYLRLGVWWCFEQARIDCSDELFVWLR